MKTFAIVLAAFLAACSGNGEAPAPTPADPKPAPAAAEEEGREPTLTKREVDQELDQIERQIESGDAEQRVVVAE